MLSRATLAAMDEQARTLPDFIADLGVTMGEFIGLCVKAFENLPTDTAVDGDDVSAILTWCLPGFIRLRAAHAGDPAALGPHAESYALLHGHAGPYRREEMTEAFRAGYLAASAPGFAPDVREQFADEMEAEGSPLCDCQGPDSNPPTSPKTGQRMPHHCECRAVLTSRVVRAGATWTRHTRECVCDHMEKAPAIG